MIYLLAVIGAVTIAVLLWRTFGAHRLTGLSAPSAKPGRRARTLAPDDDPEFLRRLGEQQRRDKPEA
jgi:hypothetical protein